ncbi:MbnP family protein [Terrimonas ferruginea]|uniref:MbnP family protein n=1 Tax=Terrimonas ferruginea TaxID=249 RepID=UPI0004056077|nr:MbnP family protein [Terrimonas ferruginea]
MKKYVFMASVAMLFIVSCKKDVNDTSDESELVPLSVEFDNIVGGQNLFLNTVTYTNGAGEDFNVSMFQYFISNISLRRADGTEYVVNQDSSYFLIRESDAATRFARVKVPEGDYRQLSFILGVDSLRSTMDITKRTGVLDPSGGMEDGMYWGWNSGYIFVKFEGISPSAPVDPSGQRKFRYHIGGFGGYSAPTINNIKKITIDLSASGIARPRKGRNANIHLMVDLLKIFNNSNNLSIATNPTVMFSDFSTNIANNYTAMFYHDHTEN